MAECSDCGRAGTAVPNGHINDRGEWINATVVLCPEHAREWARIHEEAVRQ